MPVTRSMAEEMKNLLEVLKDLKEELKASQNELKEEMKANQNKMQAAQVELKEEMIGAQDKMQVAQDKMQAAQDKMQAAQDKMQTVLQEEIKSGQEEVKTHVENQVREMKEHVYRQMECMEEEVKGVKDGFEKVKENVQVVKEDIQGVKEDIQGVKEDVKQKLSTFEKRLKDMESRPKGLPTTTESTFFRPSVKLLTFDGQTPWSVFKTQFDVVSATNGWTDEVKASQLVASLRGSAAEVLQGIPSSKLMDMSTIEKALESRFGDSHLTHFYRTELKTRRQKSGESLQILAADIERLMSLAYADCPLDVRESLAAQYFVDAIRDEETQHSTRFIDAKDLKSALAHAMRYEAAKSISKSSRHLRGVEVNNTEDEIEKKFEAFLNRIENILTKTSAKRERFSRQKSDMTCWKCNKKGHLQRECQSTENNNKEN